MPPRASFSNFYPRPPRGGRRSVRSRPSAQENFYPRPPRGGRPALWAAGDVDRLFLSTPSARRATSLWMTSERNSAQFLSTPSARRATYDASHKQTVEMISIHALREEGDTRTRSSSWSITNFYPRPPRGGRPDTTDKSKQRMEFLSTPSARRATLLSAARAKRNGPFLSTPSARRATDELGELITNREISIHALREEGDFLYTTPMPTMKIFLSTPSARRATAGQLHRTGQRRISIHALREEGDFAAVARSATLI